MGHETTTLSHLFTTGHFQVTLGPLRYDEVDIGDPLPVRSLQNGLWLSRDGDLQFAILLGFYFVADLLNLKLLGGSTATLGEAPTCQ